MEDTVYEKAIESFITEHGKEAVVESIGRLLKELYAGPPCKKELSKIIPDLERLKKRIPVLEAFTCTRIAKYIHEIIVEKFEEKSHHKDIRMRAEIILKHLWDDSERNKDSSEPGTKEEAIIQIRSGKRFPKHKDSGKRGGDKDDYKALENFLKESNNGRKNPWKPTIKLGIAALGIDLEALREYIVRGPIESVKGPDGPYVIGKVRAKPIVWSVVTAVLLIFMYISLNYLFPPNPEYNSKELRPRIHSGQLFSRQFPLSESTMIPQDTILILTDTIFYSDVLVGGDTTGLEKIRIKIRVINRSQNLVYFPDAFYLIPGQLSTLTGEIVERPVTVNAPSVNLSIQLDGQQTWPYEWVIFNHENDRPIAPLTEVYSLIEISGKENCQGIVFPFHLMIKFHNREGIDTFAKSDRLYKIAFR